MALGRWLARQRRTLRARRAALTGQSLPPEDIHFILELTPHCNQRCRYCYNIWKARPQLIMQALDTAGWCALIAKLQAETGCRRVTFSGGEPLLHPGFREILAFCHSRGLRSTLITNGQLLDAETLAFCLAHGVGMFELTLLGPEAALHDGLTRLPGSWERALAAMARLYRARAPWCGVFVATRENIGAAHATFEMLIALGAQALMFNRFNPGGENAARLELMPTPAQVRAALAALDALVAAYGVSAQASIPIMPCLVDIAVFSHVRFGFCAAGRAHQYPTLGPDGRVRPCNHSATVLGDFKAQPMAELLASPTLVEFVAAVPEVCRPCPGLARCRAGCRAAAEVCFGSLTEPEPWLRENLAALPHM